jgi:hypothetical protein
MPQQRDGIFRDCAVSDQFYARYVFGDRFYDSQQRAITKDESQTMRISNLLVTYGLTAQPENAAR